jgi:two-component system chemotaxis response regulator CheY
MDPSRPICDAGANEYMMKPFDKDIFAADFQEVGLIEIKAPV